MLLCLVYRWKFTVAGTLHFVCRPFYHFSFSSSDTLRWLYIIAHDITTRENKNTRKYSFCPCFDLAKRKVAQTLNRVVLERIWNHFTYSRGNRDRIKNLNLGERFRSNANLNAIDNVTGIRHFKRFEIIIKLTYIIFLVSRNGMEVLQILWEREF